MVPGTRILKQSVKMKTRCLVPALALALLATVSATSCRHKDIECPGTTQGIHVLFEWDRSVGAQVAGMTLYFYPLDSHSRTWRFDITGRDGGHVELPPGRYRLIACNNDLPGIALEDTGTPESIIAAARRQTDPGVYTTTGMLYGGTVQDLEVTPCGVRYVTESGTVKECGQGLVRCHPDSLATQYTVILRNVNGMRHVRSANAILKGTRRAIYLGSHIPTDTPTALAMRMDLDNSNALMTAGGCAFAPLDAAQAHYTLSLQVVKTNGKGMARDIEVRPGDLNCITGHNVIITIDGIEIPDDSPGDIGGIDVGVDGWDVVNIDVEPSIR